MPWKNTHRIVPYTLVLVLAAAAAGQTPLPPPLPGATNIVIPQARSLGMTAAAGIVIESVEAKVVVREETARTGLEIALRNTSSRRETAVLILPVPAGAVVSGFTFEGAASEPSARVLPRDEARGLFDTIVSRMLDPALLEFVDHDLVRSSVFPVPPGGTQRVRIVYEHLLAGDGTRIDYVLPRSESLEASHPWHITVDVESRHAISTLYSPSHAIVTERRGPGAFTVRLAEAAKSAPGSFRLSALRDRGDVSASLFAYPDPDVGDGGGGYFLLMAGLPAGAPAKRVKREVTIVIDRSGSMAGEKMDQAREAARQIIEGLDDGESFNIIDYSSTISMFSAAPVIKERRTLAIARRYLASIRPGGGTNIHDAVLEALRQSHEPGRIPLVLFLTDGLPTIGRTNEVTIRDMVATANRHGRRVFTIGVGADVNAPLLDAIADRTRGTSTFVGPGEDVEAKTARVFKRLFGPVFSAPELLTMDTSGARSTRLVFDVLPTPLPDLFEGDQLIVLGRYRDEGPITFRLAGDYLGARRTFDFTFSMNAATTRNAFVPRLWASRRIATLVDAVRQAGAEPAAATAALVDPRSRELVDEILALSTRFGILTEYTAFLATDGTRLDDWEELRLGCHGRLSERAVATRSGWGAINQSINYRQQAGQAVLNYRNSFVDEHLQRVEFDAVRQVNDLAFFRRGPRWVDSRLVTLASAVEPHETVMIGSERYRQLVRRLERSGRHGVLALGGNILLLVDDRIVLVTDGC